MVASASLLNKVECEEEYVIVEDVTYQTKAHEEFLVIFNRLRTENKVSGEYEDSKWFCNNSITEHTIDFVFDEVAFMRHPLCQEYRIGISTMRDMLKSYALYCVYDMIFSSIRLRINTIKDYIDKYKSQELVMDTNQRYYISEFLCFIGIAEEGIDRLTAWIKNVPVPKRRPRQLAPMINYLALEHEISEIYSSDITDEEFIKWFPVYFFTKIAFVLPIRATEITLTPLKCIERREGEIFLRIRRSRLKKRNHVVYYEPKRDYAIFEYRMPDTECIRVVKKYQEITKSIEREYLFVRTNSVRSYMTLDALNYLIGEFMDERLIGNRKYAYALYASGVQEFEHVTAGDARPIAMSNLFYQNVGVDIIRQLADHEQLCTSGGYFTNVSETVLASSIMNIQREMDHERMNMKSDMIVTSEAAKNPPVLDSKCASPFQPLKTGNITDCKKEGYLEDCLGCRYFQPNESELEIELNKRRKKLESAELKVIQCLREGMSKNDTDTDKVLLDIHTAMARYKAATDKLAQEKRIKWQRHQDSMMTCY